VMSSMSSTVSSRTVAKTFGARKHMEGKDFICKEGGLNHLMVP
jgi:hypothetical protein